MKKKGIVREDGKVIEATYEHLERKMSVTRPFKQLLYKRRLHSTSSVDPSAVEYSTHSSVCSQLSTPVEITEYKTQPYRYAYNIILIGDSNVGKSCLKDYYLDREFNSCQPSTLVVDFQTAYTQIDGHNLVLNIWDAAGHPSFKIFAPSYYKKCCAILLVFSMTDRASFESIQNWLSKAKKDSPAVVYVLVGNKADAKDKREVSSEDAREYAQFNDLFYFETTCMGGTSVEDMFYSTIQMLYKISTKTKQDGLKKLGIKIGIQTK